jgi:uncharacterized protein (TIGR03437 family)
MYRYLENDHLGNNRVRRVAPDGTITTVAGNGQKGSGADGGAATGVPLLTPRNVAVDGAGNVYLSEFEGHRVRKVAADGKISTAAGTGIAGFRGDGGAATAAQIAFPAGLAVDRTGALYIADSQNQRIRKILPGGVISTLVGRTPATPLSTPVAVAVDVAGTVYVSDQFAVRACTAGGSWTNVAGGADDLAVDASGNLYMAVGTYVHKMNGSGTITTYAGDGYLHSIGDDGDATAAELFRPAAVALDTAGNLYIADAGTQRIRKVSGTGKIGTIAGNGVAGFAGDGGPAIAALVRGPMGVAVDAAGNVLVADTGNERIRQISAGKIATIIGTGTSGLAPEGLPGTQTPVNSPQGICISHAGTLYVVDTANHRVLETAPGMAIATAAGNGSPGDAGDGGLARLAQLNQPAACALDTAGDLFIADTLNHRIRKVTPDGAISTVAGTGTAGFSGDGGPAPAALLSGPAGIAVDDGGDIYIADTGNNRIRQVTPDGQIQTIAGGNSASAGADPAATLSAPSGLVLDGSGNLYFADTNHNLIRKLIPSAAGPVTSVPVTAPPLSVANAASLLPGPVAPGETLTITGLGLGPEAGVAGGLDASGLLANLAGGTEVRFDGVPAPVFYAQASQVNVQAPYTIAGDTSTNIEVRYNGQSAGTATLAVAAAAPALYPAVANQDGSLNSQTQPAPRGSVVTVYGTGEGLTDGANISGQAATTPCPKPKLAATLAIGSVNAELLYLGSAPNLVGTLQINARVPGGFVPPGPANAQLTVGTATSPAITIWLQ